MSSAKIAQPSLYLRSGYFIDRLRAETGLGMVRLERRIRERQYEARGLTPPSVDLVRDYFRLHRAVAFEPRLGRSVIAPWLLAAELEFPGSSLAFFHPIFDWLFGQVESAIFWDAHFRKIPEPWIADAARRGDVTLVQEWRAINRGQSKLRHRRKINVPLNDLALIHLSMMRLPEPIMSQLFERQGLTMGWTRRYGGKRQIQMLLENPGVDSLCALALLTDEAVKIGDGLRFGRAREGAMVLLKGIASYPGCQRIGSALERQLMLKLKAEEFAPMRYSQAPCYGIGLPTSWLVMAAERMLESLVTPTNLDNPRPIIP
ncbi:hypothetical protein [Ferribacterium limneticum]|uniref:hypothetical protein n=1 Tax=Ferribacterium limneticum TaxID=76259 RepID=UPI001CF9F78E|nr:hypothetical protein [Ferribacterium limneticum]UCV28139.1 hypothetical protein KI617_18150 [Ferribacterium limneticum]UCV32056.1 hypothetical protein KI608_18150 [Ferribacterium limneticum]